MNNSVKKYFKNDLNSLLIEGTAVTDPAYKEIGNGKTPFASFCVANNRYFKKDDKTERESSYFEVEVWGGNALRVTENVKVGARVRLVCRIKQLRWITPEQRRRQRVVLVAFSVDVLGENCSRAFGPDYYDFTSEDENFDCYAA